MAEAVARDAADARWTGERIRSIRVARGWSQEHLARALGVTLSTVGRWERDEQRATGLSRRRLEEIARDA